jgi:MOSC domain-containing protein YiiM
MMASNLDFASPFKADSLLEIRVSHMKKMPGLDVMSGIDKTLCDMPMHVSKLGLEGDEHDPTFHGGPDKAILGCESTSVHFQQPWPCMLAHFFRSQDCSSHYPNWQSSYPDRSGKFVPGGFGENFVTAHMNERNVCIGDVISVGPEVILQVSLPRQPCFKLNHRFSLKNFAPVTYQTSRTGWYYRVLQEGSVKVGDELRLVERKWPEWTIERIQEYLHRNTDNEEMNKEISQIEALGAEAKGQFQKRVAKAKAKSKSKSEIWKDYKVIGRTAETSRVVSLILEATNPDDSVDDKGAAGLHARIKLPNGLIRPY